jgi:hypothetical protein
MAGRLRPAAPALVTYGAIRLIGFGVMAWMAPYVTWKGHHRSLAYLTGIWDGAAYQRIALHGYDLAMRQDPALWRHAVDLAWFPGYPATIDALRWLPGLTVSGAGLVVTLIAGFAAAWGIMSLGTELAGEPRVGLVLAALWAVAPGSISLQMTYADALFCALAAWALVALARRQWLTAGLLTCLAGTVRSTAMALIAAVIVAAAVQLIRSRADWWRPVAAALLAPLGLAGYWIFVAWATRQKSGWFWVEQHFWVQGNHPRSPVAGVTDTWHDIVTVLLVGGKQPLALVTLIVVAAVVLLLWSFAEPLPLYARVYTVAIVLLALDTGWFYPAEPRYLLPAFMLALPVARMLARAPARVLIPMAGFLAAASAWFGIYMMLIAGVAPLSNTLRQAVVGSEPDDPDVQDQGTGVQFPGTRQRRPVGGQRVQRRGKCRCRAAEKQQLSRPYGAKHVAAKPGEFRRGEGQVVDPVVHAEGIDLVVSGIGCQRPDKERIAAVRR